jgi:hypothetical protein
VAKFEVEFVDRMDKEIIEASGYDAAPGGDKQWVLFFNTDADTSDSLYVLSERTDVMRIQAKRIASIKSLG